MTFTLKKESINNKGKIACSKVLWRNVPVMMWKTRSTLSDRRMGFFAISQYFQDIKETHWFGYCNLWQRGVSSNFLLLSRNCLIPRKNSLRIPPYAIISNYMYINKVCAGVTNIDVYKNECRYFLVKRFTLKLNYPHFQNNYCNEKH